MIEDAAATALAWSPSTPDASSITPMNVRCRWLIAVLYATTARTAAAWASPGSWRSASSALAPAASKSPACSAATARSDASDRGARGAGADLAHAAAVARNSAARTADIRDDIT